MRLGTGEDIPFIEAVLGYGAKPIMEKCITLVTDYGGIFFDPLTPSIFEAHIFFHPKGRGRHAINACKQAMDFAWDNGAHIIIGRIPVEDRGARLMARWMGFRSVGIKPQEDKMVEWFEIRRDECLREQ